MSKISAPTVERCFGLSFRVGWSGGAASNMLRTISLPIFIVREMLEEKSGKDLEDLTSQS